MSTRTQVSHRSFLLRLRSLAKMALQYYGLKGAEMKFINYSGNGIYQVIVHPDTKPASALAPGKYALRLHQPNYMKSESISSEMDWLSALHQAGVPVPKPFRNQESDWLTVVGENHDLVGRRNCTLIGWTEGRILKKRILPKHFRELGVVIGRMHEQSRSWKRPKGFARPHWDWEGLFGDGFGYGAPALETHNAIPKGHQNIFNETLRKVQETTEQLGKGKNTYGLIHADLSLLDNVTFLAGKAYPFDFDDCGFGYWIFDLAVLLAHYFSDFTNTSTTLQDALIAGYKETSPLENIGFEYLDLFIAARYAQLMFFYQSCAIRYPRVLEEAMIEVNKYAIDLKHTLKKIT